MHCPADELQSLLRWLERKADVEDSHAWLPDALADTAINGVRVVITEVRKRIAELQQKEQEPDA